MKITIEKIIKVQWGVKDANSISYQAYLRVNSYSVKTQVGPEYKNREDCVKFCENFVCSIRDAKGIIYYGDIYDELGDL